jgi:hypothetical protein
MNTKLFHLHLKDVHGNLKTLICRLKDGSIVYSLYGGTGSSGPAYALSCIQFYDLVNGNMSWNEKSLPIENEEGESAEEFKQRVLDMLNHSTYEVIKDVSIQVKFS